MPEDSGAVDPLSHPCALVRAETAVVPSTEIHSITESGSRCGPKMAFASARPRSTSNPVRRPLESCTAKGMALSSTPILIFPLV